MDEKICDRCLMLFDRLISVSAGELGMDEDMEICHVCYDTLENWDDEVQG